MEKRKISEKYILSFLERWGQKGLNMQPLKNYKLGIYANGKVITMVDTIDGNSPLWGNYQLEDGKYKHNRFMLYFHRPKAGGPLEVIR